MVRIYTEERFDDCTSDRHKPIFCIWLVDDDEEHEQGRGKYGKREKRVVKNFGV